MAFDLFDHPIPEKEGPHVFSVTEITQTVRALVEEQIGTVWVEGEISNCRKQASGHQYFTLKDADCQLACVLFARPGMWRKQINLADGMQVQVRGTLTVYEARGQYQLNVQLVQAGGAGLLQARFEALKRKLAAEGLFETARKKPLPKFPRTVGIVTSPTGAALRDMLNILTRRAPWIRLIINPVRVQGEGAASEIAAAIREFNHGHAAIPQVDLIIVARGGGSAEDLWQFNEEGVARAIVTSEVPVVSAVGHEVDFTIADFVADLRAPTPSAAAEMIAPDRSELLRRLEQTEALLRRRIGVILEQKKDQLTYLARTALFREPRNRFQEAMQRLDLAQEGLHRAAQNRIKEGGRRLNQLFAVLRQHRPDQLIAIRRQHLDSISRRMSEQCRRTLERNSQRLRTADTQLRLLSPNATLERGYSITTDAEGAVLHSIAQAEPGRKIITRLTDGSFGSVVDEAG